MKNIELSPSELGVLSSFITNRISKCRSFIESLQELEEMCPGEYPLNSELISDAEDELTMLIILRSKF